MKKLFVMAAMVLSSVGAFAQQAAGTTTIQPKVGLNVSTIGDNALPVQNCSIRLPATLVLL